MALNERKMYHGVFVLPQKQSDDDSARHLTYYSCSPTDEEPEKTEKCYWGVSIWVDGKTIWLGSFHKDEEELAAKVYDAHMYYYHGKSFNQNIYKLNGLLTEEEIEDIHQNGIPDKYTRRNKNKNVLPRGISRRGTKFRVCVQRNGKKLEKIVDRLDDAINLLNSFIH